MKTRKNFLNPEETQYASRRDAGFDSPDGERRGFLLACSVALTSTVAQIAASPDAEAASAASADSSTASTRRSSPRVLTQYANSILTDETGLPVKASVLKPLTNYLFHYPYVSTPCLLLDLGRDVGGVGSRKSIVAFSAICSHKLAYPAREVSFIRFQAKASLRSEAERIHCCADHSVYDPAMAAKVVAGPAPLPLAAVALAFDSKTDTLRAVGISGIDQFAPFFAKYEFKLNMEFGSRANAATATTTRLQELTQYCRSVAQC